MVPDSTPPDIYQSDIFTLPVFPLPNVVLYPGSIVRLHIFEPRYREMVKQVLENQGSFGIHLCKHYNPVTMQGEPFDVGTTVEFLEAEPLPDGRYYLVVKGRRRYQVSHYDHRLEYLRGTGFWLDETDKRPVAKASDLVKSVKLQFVEVIQKALDLLGEDMMAPEFPETPEALSYYVADNIRGSLALKQVLLEETSTRKRLKHEQQMMAEILKTLSIQSQIEAVFKESGQST
jgi:ATP-dependent Lon protease